MPLSIGTRLGPYEIVCAIGAGGMGQVYRARDTRLQRDVALKVLPDLFASDPERLARFEREAKTLGTLNAQGCRERVIRAPAIGVPGIARSRGRS